MKGRTVQAARFPSMWWTVPNEWTDQTAYIVCGGPSVPSNTADLLKGRRTIVINSSYQLVPDADFLLFGDARWWHLHKTALASFKGRIVTIAAVVEQHVCRLQRLDLKVGLSLNPTGLVMGRTSLQAAINLAFLLGSRRIVLIGADMGAAPDGKTHHHDPHPWPQRPNCWDDQMRSLSYMVEPLKAQGCEIINTSPVSRIPWWPKVSLGDCL